MKHVKIFRLLLLAVFCLSSTLLLHSQSADSLYKVSKYSNGVWVIEENKTVNIYVVEGTDSALVIDTGYGKGDLKSLIEKITKLPLIVVNTHGHGDHVGGDHQFSKVYAHAADFELISNKLTKEGQETVSTKLIPINEGYVFDLGGRKLEVIEVPGHTHGSICLLDKGNKRLFAGDNTNELVWLFLNDCFPLEVYLKSLQKVEKLMHNFTVVMPGHNTPLKNTFVSDQIACVQSILNGTCTPEPYNYSDFTAGSMLCTYKKAKVAYNPDNLFIEKK